MDSELHSVQWILHNALFRRLHRLAPAEWRHSKSQIKLCKFHRATREHVVWKEGHKWDYISYKPKDTIAFMTSWRWNQMLVSEKLSDQGDVWTGPWDNNISRHLLGRLNSRDCHSLANPALEMNEFSKGNCLGMNTGDLAAMNSFAPLAWLFNGEGRSRRGHQMQEAERRSARCLFF